MGNPLPHCRPSIYTTDPHPSNRARTALLCLVELVKMAGLSPQITNLIIMLGMMQVSKKIPFDDPQVLTMVRGAYLASNLIIALIYLYVQMQVNKKNDKTNLKYANPLLMQSIIPLKSALENNLVKIHVYGQPASGDLKRPFKAAGGFMGAMQGGGAQSDKKAVEAAERAGRGGIKDE